MELQIFNFVNNEKNIINLIKYGAIISIIIISVFITQIFIYEKNKDLNSELLKMQESYISTNKIIVENLVNKIYNLIELERSFEKEDFDLEIKEEVNQAYSTAMSIYNENIKESNYSEEKTINSIKNALREIRFNNNGYLFLYKMNGENILNTEFPNIEGKNLLEYQDSKGTFILKEMTNILQNQDETFYEWYWQEFPSDKTEYKKIGFFKKITSLNMFIGGGYYYKNFNEQTQKRILKKLNNLKLKKPEHIFIYDINGLCLVNPKKELIGLNRYDIKNENGIYTIRDTIDFTLKNKEGFINYNSTVKLNNSLKSNDKISFVKLYEDWGWIMGSGFYLEELNNNIKEKKDSLIKSNKSTIQQIIFIAFIITLIMIFISFYLANVINNMFINYKLKINSEIIKTIEKEKMLIQQSKMATMGEMIGSIAHQWKQPLSIISMSNGLLKINSEVKDFSTHEEIINAIENIDNSIHNLSQTIDDFRNFFNPNKEKIAFHITIAFEDTLKLINSQFKNNNIEIIKNIKDIQILGYKNELLQVLINLLKNSKEELVEKNNSEKRYIFINAYKEKKNLIIEIKDNANGISNEIINNIFNAYFTTKEKEGGTGIGLYISKQIIEESMKGEITVSNVEYKYENENYKGAEFIITLPTNLEE